MITQILIIVTLLWMGMIVGISFLESWVKFQTPGLSKPLALAVGRTVFRAFHKAQYGLMVMLFIMGLIAHLLMWNWVILLSIIFALALQGLWLLPFLSNRVDRLLAGKHLSRSYFHFIYGILEMTKLGLLFCLTLILMTKKFGL